jgi:hypothetical protein
LPKVIEYLPAYLGATMLGITILGIRTLIIMTLSITTLSIILNKKATLRIITHNRIAMQSVVYSECLMC